MRTIYNSCLFVLLIQIEARDTRVIKDPWLQTFRTKWGEKKERERERIAFLFKNILYIGIKHPGEG